MSRKQIPFWLVNPMLTGRFVWNRSRRRNTTAEHCEEIDYREDHRFTPLITDEEHQRIKQRLLSASTATNSGLRNRRRRMLTGLVRCSKCRNALGYKKGGTSQLYLRLEIPIKFQRQELRSLHWQVLRPSTSIGVLVLFPPRSLWVSPPWAGSWSMPFIRLS